MKLRITSLAVLCLVSLTALGQSNSEPMSASESTCKNDEATMIVSRDDRLRGSAIHSRILLDGKELGEITRGKQATFCVSAGEHIVGVASDFFGGMGAQKRELAVEFKPDKTYAFRVFILYGQGAMIERTAL